MWCSFGYSRRAHYLEHAIKLQEILIEELNELQNHVKYYLATCDSNAQFFNEIHYDYDVSLKAYDKLIANITHDMKLIRKFNLQLKASYLPRFREIISKQNWQEVKALNYYHSNSQSMTATSFDVMTKFNHIRSNQKELEFSSNENRTMSNINHTEDFIFPEMDLIDMYNSGTVINGKITVVDEKKQKFYIQLAESIYNEMIKSIEQSIDLHQYLTIPPEYEIFGLACNNRIVRATRSFATLYDNELQENFWHCYLLDYGEIVKLKYQDLTYKLTLEQQVIPAQAIECRLKEQENYSMQFLKENYLKLDQVPLEIININKNYLEVLIIEQKKSSIANVDNIALNGLIQAEMDKFYDEPFSTSNIMKAVMGHDPQDEKRICRFYDPHTGCCFKGANCRQEHTLLQPEGWTKDAVPDCTFFNNDVPHILYNKGDIINITPTFVNEFGMFYCQINDEGRILEPLLWIDEQVPKSRMLQKPPSLFELVLSRYGDDGLWHRALIISQGDDLKMFEVFYVDYGNTDWVHIRNLAKCSNHSMRLPYRAVLCKIEGAINIAASLSQEKRKKGIKLMTEIILNKELHAKVCSHIEILVITFVDEPYASMVDLIKKKLECDI